MKTELEQNQELTRKAEETFPYEFMIEKSFVDCKRIGYKKGLQENQTFIKELIKAIDTLVLCSDFQESKKKYSNTTDHWTKEIDVVLNKIHGT